MGRVSLPPGQQLAAAGKWPLVGERAPRDDNRPWTVSVDGLVAERRIWTLAELAAMPQTQSVIDIHCVTRWSQPGMVFSGVMLAELLARSRPDGAARFILFVARSERGHATSLPLKDAHSLGALVALTHEGKPLSSPHGGPVRMVVPGRYFYKSLKWLERIELLADDRLGYWEAEAGYHNRADPWREERYIAAGLSRQEAARLLAARDVSQRNLLGLCAEGRDLSNLVAGGALLRNANFRGAILRGACFDGANLSNAHLAGADLREATFRGADLEGADFRGADLRGADLRGASLLAATFVSADDGRTHNPAILDSATLIDPSALDALMPPQAAFVRPWIAPA
jgi:hypothetical protein